MNDRKLELIQENQKIYQKMKEIYSRRRHSVKEKMLKSDPKEFFRLKTERKPTRKGTMNLQNRKIRVLKINKEN